MTAIPDVFGAYFWAGYDVPNALVPGLEILQQAGFRTTARIRLVPGMRAEYRFDEQWDREVPSTVPFLPAAVRSTQFQRAFSLPGFCGHLCLQPMTRRPPVRQVINSITLI